MVNEKIYVLSELFYNDYGSYREILKKTDRPYCIATIKIDNLTFAIPFRTNIPHPFAYKFKNSPRSNNSGLDFSKAVVITSPSYIGEETLIDSYEYALFIQNKTVITNRFKKFLKDYKTWVTDPVYYKREKLIMMSSLQYFHLELGITI